MFGLCVTEQYVIDTGCYRIIIKSKDNDSLLKILKNIWISKSEFVMCKETEIFVS